MVKNEHSQKKRIAVFASGWAGEYVKEVLNGITERGKQKACDIFAFLNFSVRVPGENTNAGEFNIFTLPNLEDFDGVILLANSFNDEKEFRYLQSKIQETGIKAVSLEYEIEGIPTIFSDNYAGMYELVSHIVKEHGARDLVFIGGPKDHPECQERLQAFLDVTKENDIAVLDNHIFFNDWSKNAAINSAQKYIDTMDTIPDAFVCANDVMAIGIVDWLEKNGHMVPTDVIVTGYDGTEEGRIHKPIITSVNHQWGTMGQMALDMVLRQLAGEMVSENVRKTTFAKGESCGCQTDSVPQNRIKEEKQKEAKWKVDAVTLDSHFRHIYLAVRKAENADEVSWGLNYLFSHDYLIEGREFKVCLEKGFFHIEEGDINLKQEGYGEQFHLACCVENGEPCGREIVERNEIIFRSAQKKQETGLYMFVPIYGETKTYGFAMLTGDTHFLGNNYLYIWTRHMNQDMEQVRRNITISDLNRKLSKLSVTDELTGAYNRAGCEKIAYPMLEAWREAKGIGIVLLVDVDHMKVINDEYGHASGDLALKATAQVLMENLPAQWVVSRFGGDEFFVGGRQEEQMDLLDLRQKLYSKMEEKVKKENFSFPLTISVGYAVINPDEGLEIEKYLQRADAQMYEEKRKHHQGDV